MYGCIIHGLLICEIVPNSSAHDLYEIRQWGWGMEGGGGGGGVGGAPGGGLRYE